MACEALGAMRSLSGALRFGHPEGAARPARGGRGRRAGLARLVRPRGEQRPAPQRADRHPGSARGAGPHRSRPGHPPVLRPGQAGQNQADPAALCARGGVPEPGGPPAPGRGFRGTGPRSGQSGRGRAPRARCRRTLSPGTGTGAEPDDRVLAGGPARHSPRCPHAGVRRSTGRSLAAGDLWPVCARITGIPGPPGTSGSALAAPVPAGDAPGRTRLGATGPRQPSTTATHAARRSGAPWLRQLTRSSCSASPDRHRPGIPAPRGRFRSGIPAPRGRFRPGVSAPSGRLRPGVPAPSGRLRPGIPAPSGRLRPGIPASPDCRRPGRRSGSRWSARLAHPATRPGLRIPRGRPFSPVRPGPRNRSAARTTVAWRPPAPA